tara:strand:+ start:731 stop:1084 length:354 start_codon:yes stop_codon:yes gene_type:complete
MTITKFDAVLALVGNVSFGVTPEGVILWHEVVPNKPTEDAINAKLAELQAAEPMRLLRQERDRLIALTDWRFRSDLSPSQAWIDYCQALRDLPATASPSLDENGNLTGVTWPTPPSE